MFDAVKRFLRKPQPPTRPVAARFDDGLTEIARLIARDAPTGERETPTEALLRGMKCHQLGSARGLDARFNLMSERQ